MSHLSFRKDTSRGGNGHVRRCRAKQDLWKGKREAASYSVLPICEPGLSETLEEVPSILVVAGESLTYSIKVVNLGPSDAGKIVISESYDKNFSFSSSTPSPDRGTNNQWTFKGLKAGETQTISVTGRVNPSTAKSLLNKVSLVSDTSDP